MPTVFRAKGFRFFFFSNEGTEPVHIHVEKGDAYAKVWINPVILAYNRGFMGQELRQVLDLTESNQEIITNSWDEYFNNK